MRTKSIFAALIFIAVCACLTFMPQHAFAENTEITPAPQITLALNPQEGEEIGFVYEAFLSPQQEPAEEEDTPALAPKAFLSTKPSLLRDERKSLGHGILRFTKNLSKAYVDVKVEGVDIEDVNMFHIHCGRPDLLGPILIDFANSGDIQANFADGIFSTTETNDKIEEVVAQGEGIVGAYAAGCPIIPGTTDKVKTIAGMQYIAQQGELYFNLHTKGQTFYGDIRGKLHPVEISVSSDDTNFAKL